jgi:hypothetical protein
VLVPAVHVRDDTGYASVDVVVEWQPV